MGVQLGYCSHLLLRILKYLRCVSGLLAFLFPGRGSSRLCYRSLDSVWEWVLIIIVRSATCTLKRIQTPLAELVFHLKGSAQLPPLLDQLFLCKDLRTVLDHDLPINSGQRNLFSLLSFGSLGPQPSASSRCDCNCHCLSGLRYAHRLRIQSAHAVRLVNPGCQCDTVSSLWNVLSLWLPPRWQVLCYFVSSYVLEDSMDSQSCSLASKCWCSSPFVWCQLVSSWSILCSVVV